MKNENTCGYGIKYDEFNQTCLTTNYINSISKDYNDYVKSNDKEKKNDIINLNSGKKNMLKQLRNNLKDYCKEDICLSKLPFLSNKNKFLLKNFFKPQGTKGKYDWLSTIEINQLFEQIQLNYNKFLFIGAVPIDILDISYPLMNQEKFIKDINLNYLRKIKKPILGFVYNLDRHYESGSHWVALYANILEKKIYFSDSYGLPPHKEIKKMVKKIAEYIHKFHNEICKNKIKSKCEIINIPDNVQLMNNNNDKKYGDILYNRNRQQYGNSECGVYSCYFIIKLLEGYSFEQIQNNIIDDETINKFRKVWWR